MSDPNITPNMNLPVPVPGVTPGSTTWADDLVADMSAIDSHDHSAGKGVQVTPDGLDISSDLSFGSNNATDLRTVRFTPQIAALAAATDLGCLYEVNNDLYYNDGAGNQVRITQSGSVTGSTGTITGLPSGTASAAYSAGTFTFQSATNTPANMAVGPLIIGRNTASSKTVSLTPNAGQAANYDLSFPAALPGSTGPATIDTSGNIAVATTTGSGAFVQATTPTITTPVFSGVSTGTITGNTFSPTFVVSQTYTVVDSTHWYTRLGNVVTVYGSFKITNTSVSSANLTSTTIPIATASLLVFGTLETYFDSSPASASNVIRLINSGTTLVVPFSTGAGSTIGNGVTGTWIWTYSYVVS